MLVRLPLVFAVFGFVSFEAMSATVSIDALNGVLEDGEDTVYEVDSAIGPGSGITLAADKVAIKGIVQKQSAVEAIVRMTMDQVLTLGSVSIAEGVSSGLRIGDVEKDGEIRANANPMVFTVPQNGVDIEVCAMAYFTNRVGAARQRQTVLKTGPGRLAFKGGFAMSVTNDQGSLYFSDAFNGCPGLTVSGDGGQFAVSSLIDGGEFFGFLPQAGTDVRPAERENVFRTDSQTAVSSFLVMDGSVARCKNAQFYNAEVAQDPSGFLTDVPDCCVIATNSTGVMVMEGGSYEGKLVIGGNGDSRGALFLTSGAKVTNYCSVDGEWLLGRAGYGYLEIGQSSEYTAAGTWYAGHRGQFNVVIRNGVFKHTPASERKSGFGFGGASSQASLFIGDNGRFDAEGAVSVAIPARDESGIPDLVQVTVEGGGSFQAGTNVISAAETSVFNINAGGTFYAAGIYAYDALPIVQFNGGTFVATASRQLFSGKVLMQGGGATVSVPVGVSATMGAPIESASGNGMESIQLTTAVANHVFAGPPAVEVNGGGGATAICEYDQYNRKVTSIRVTGRGSGYSGTKPRIYLLYGDDSYRIENVEMSANGLGTFTKTGSGTLVFDQPNTYTGETTIAEGTLKIECDEAIPPASTLRMNGGVLDLGGEHTLEFADMKGNGEGHVENGTVTLNGLSADVASGSWERLNMTNIVFSSTATVKLANATDQTLDRNAEYVLYEFTGGVIPSRMPPIDPEIYANGLSEAWAIAVIGNKAVLRYFGGSTFIYY